MVLLMLLLVVLLTVRSLVTHRYAIARDMPVSLTICTVVACCSVHVAVSLSIHAAVALTLSKLVLILPCNDAMTTQACAAPAAAGSEADGEAAATEPVVVVKDAGKRYSEVLLALSQLATAGFIAPLPQVHDSFELQYLLL
jgi:hypothetical protein